MFKRSIWTVAAFALAMAVSTQAYSICGGTVVYDNDCDSNAQAYAESCCPQGYRVQGVVYNDLKGQDNTDAIGAVCRHVKNGNVLIASDFQNRGENGNKPAVSYVCDKTEVLAGILCKDLQKKDALDGCTAICQKPGGQKMIMSNPDLDSNPRDYVYHTVDLPNRVAGIGYKEEREHTDRADCGNISYRYEPIVK